MDKLRFDDDEEGYTKKNDLVYSEREKCCFIFPLKFGMRMLGFIQIITFVLYAGAAVIWIHDGKIEIKDLVKDPDNEDKMKWVDKSLPVDTINMLILVGGGLI